MFRKGLIMAALLAFPAIAAAEFQATDFELTLSGSGASGPDADGFSAGVNVGLGYFATDELEVGVRQTISYQDVSTPPNSGGALSGSTRVFVDYHFDMGNWQPFIGANIGYVYGDLVQDTWEAAPEAGVKYFVNSTTFIYGTVEYQFFFDKAADADSSFDDGQFVYSLGIGLIF